MSTLALVVIARNEQPSIARCLESAKPIVDEIIVVDTGSTDQTKTIVGELGAKVFDFSWCDDFSAARNFALSCSSSNWNLILDADEYIAEANLDAIHLFIKQPNAVGRVQIISENFQTEEHTETRNFITRLIPKGIQFKGRIHEQIDSSLPRTNVPIVVRHSGYVKGNKANRNIPLLLEELKTYPLDPYYHYHLAKEYQGLNDFDTSRYHFSKAYELLTGKERFAPNIVVDYLYLLIKLKAYGLALEMIEKKHPWVLLFPDYHFACGIFYLDLVIHDPGRYLSSLPLIEASYHQCLKLGETDRYDSVAGTGSYAAWYNLGNYYEVLGNKDQAIHCYKTASQLGYEKAAKRLDEIA